MKRVKFCPKCMNIIHKKDTACSSCGMLVSDMENQERVEDKLKAKKAEPEIIVDETGKELTKKEIIELKKKKQIDFEKEFLVVDENKEKNSEEQSSTGVESKPKRHKHKPKKKDSPNFSVDEAGEYKIDTKDVTFFETQEEYSVKKARGDYKPEKIEWWEIYKWADRMLARRKIKKEVNKAARVKPEYISKGKLLTLCILFGWMGVHNFYARNHVKGWTLLSMFIVMLVVVYTPVLYVIMGIFVGGGFGFVLLSMWMYDMFAIMTNRYKYRVTKLQFIRKLNIETRAKLGKRYIDIK